MSIFEGTIARLGAVRDKLLSRGAAPLRPKVVERVLQAKPPALDPRSRPGLFGGERGQLTRRPAPGLVRPGGKVSPRVRPGQPRPAVEKISTAGPKAPPETLKSRIPPSTGGVAPSPKSKVPQVVRLEEDSIRKLLYGLLNAQPLISGHTQPPEVTDEYQHARLSRFYNQQTIASGATNDMLEAPPDAARVIQFLRISANNAAAIGTVGHLPDSNGGIVPIQVLGGFSFTAAFQYVLLLPETLGYILGPGERIRVGSLAGATYLYELSCFYVDIPRGQRPRKNP